MHAIKTTATKRKKKKKEKRSYDLVLGKKTAVNAYLIKNSKGEGKRKGGGGEEGEGCPDLSGKI